MRKIFKYITVAFMALFCLVSGAYAQEMTVTGTVKDQSGAPMPGVAVIVKSTTTGVTTDLDGRYSIVCFGTRPRCG